MRPNEKSHCGYCGKSFTQADFPKTCSNCGQITYFNPKPVAVILQPIGDGLLLVRRDEEPGVGSLALPGGFMEAGETWQESMAREFWEETGITKSPTSFHLHQMKSTPDGEYLLVFAQTDRIEPTIISSFRANEEVSELVIGKQGETLFFPLHQEVFDDFLGT